MAVVAPTMVHESKRISIGIYWSIGQCMSYLFPLDEGEEALLVAVGHHAFKLSHRLLFQPHLGEFLQT